MPKRELVLDTNDRSCGDGCAYLSAIHIAYSDVSDQTLELEAAEFSNTLRERHFRIRSMKVIDVYSLDTQISQGSLACAG